MRQDKSIDEDPEWDVEFYADDNGREPCREWAERLSPQKRAAFIAAIRLVLACRGLDVVKTEYGKARGEGLYEFRIRWTAAEISHKVSGLPAADIGGAPKEILLQAFLRHGRTQDHPPAEWLRQSATFRRPVAAARDR